MLQPKNIMSRGGESTPGQVNTINGEGKHRRDVKTCGSLFGVGKRKGTPHNNQIMPKSLASELVLDSNSITTGGDNTTTMVGIMEKVYRNMWVCFDKESDYKTLGVYVNWLRT